VEALARPSYLSAEDTGDDKTMMSIMFLPAAVLAVAFYEKDVVSGLLLFGVRTLTFAAYLVWGSDLPLLWHRWMGRHWHLR
jgi:hypothetical protein